jgi:hypothetical protein
MQRKIVHVYDVKAYGELRYSSTGIPFLSTKGMKKIWKSLKIEPVNEKLRSYSSHWLRHVTRMNNRIKKEMGSFRRNGRRRLGKPLKRLRQGRNRSVKA